MILLNHMKRSFAQSLHHAIQGLHIAFRRERNLRIHCAVGVAVVGAGWFLSVSLEDLVILVMMISIVMFAECINTALEMLSDVQNPRLSAHIGALKDVSAAGVLIVSIASVIVGILIFLPHL